MMNSTTSAMRTFTINVIPIALAYVLLILLIRIAIAMRAEWLLLNGAEFLAAIAGLVVAWRFGARAAIIVLAAGAAYAAALFAVHAGLGVRAAQGAPTHIAVLVAASIGVMAGASIMHRARRTA